jgi:beta-lysine 5,6-aminomutase alpha subunit
MTGKLDLDPRVVAEARRLAAVAAEPVIELARTHTTVSVERATLRMAGLSGADPASFSTGEGAGTQPWVNTVVDAVRDQVGLEHGVALPVWHALLSGEYADLHELAAKTAAGSVRFALPEGRDADRTAKAARRAVQSGLSQVDRRRKERDRLVRRYGDPPEPWIYLIVATGEIHEDIPQAQAAAREGADVVAVIRSTGQSLLDYVPEGATAPGTPGRTRRRRTSGSCAPPWMRCRRRSAAMSG